MITRWGLPEGVGRLSAEHVRQRNASLAFHKHGRRGPVHEIRLVNSRGTYHPVGFNTLFLSLASLNPLSQETVDGHSEAIATSRVVFERDARGQILNQIGYNRANRRIYTLHYVHPNQAEYKTAEWISSPVRESGIALLKFVRPASGPEAGLAQEVRYFDSAGTPQPDRSGVYGCRYLFDARGLPVQGIVLGADGQPAVSKEGIATSTITYDALGNPTQVTSFGRDGQAVLTKYGAAGMKFAYNPSGNLQEITAVGTDGQLVTMSLWGGAAGRSFRYDARGNVVETTFFDLHRQPVTGRAGTRTTTVATFAKQKIEWDEHGGATETYFGTDGKPIVSMGQIVQTRSVWDARGYPVETSYFDEHGRPIRNNEAALSSDKRRTPTVASLNRPAWTKRIIPYTRRKDGRRSRGSVTTVVMPWKSAILALRANQNAMTSAMSSCDGKYNAQGKPIALAFFDAAEQPVNTKEGYAKVTAMYNLQGHLTEALCSMPRISPTCGKAIMPKCAAPITPRIDPSRKRCMIRTGTPHATRTATSPCGMPMTTGAIELKPLTLTRATIPRCTPMGTPSGINVQRPGPEGRDRVRWARRWVYPAYEDGFAKVRWTYNARGQVEQQTYVDAQDRLVQSTTDTRPHATATTPWDGKPRRLFFDVHGVPVQTRVT